MQLLVEKLSDSARRELEELGNSGVGSLEWLVSWAALHSGCYVNARGRNDSRLRSSTCRRGSCDLCQLACGWRSADTWLLSGTSNAEASARRDGSGLRAAA
jgi:hypothetical protein